MPPLPPVFCPRCPDGPFMDRDAYTAHMMMHATVVENADAPLQKPPPLTHFYFGMLVLNVYCQTCSWTIDLPDNVQELVNVCAAHGIGSHASDWH
jgi:hypothetical protein